MLDIRLRSSLKGAQAIRGFGKLPVKVARLPCRHRNLRHDMRRTSGPEQAILAKTRSGGIPGAGWKLSSTLRENSRS